MAVNPVTNKIYIANHGNDSVTVIDGATNATSTVPAGNYPRGGSREPGHEQNLRRQLWQQQRDSDRWRNERHEHGGRRETPIEVAVNPVTNKIYVANNSSNNVTVIDGATNATTTVAAGETPWAVAVNPVTNKIYVANYLGSNNVTVIDGATNATTTVAAGGSSLCRGREPGDKQDLRRQQWQRQRDGHRRRDECHEHGGRRELPEAVAVNPITNKIYVANYCAAT